jgi:putative membrane protein
MTKEMTPMNALAPLLATAGSHHGWHHGAWCVVGLILVLLLVALVVAYFRRRRGGPGNGGGSPHRILGERFARGEISADEYRERLGQLQ